MTYTVELEVEQIEAIVSSELKREIMDFTSKTEEDRKLRLALFRVLEHFSIPREYYKFVDEYNDSYKDSGRVSDD